VDETYVKILGKWHYLYRGIDLDGQVLDCWLSRNSDLAAAEAFFRRTISSTGCTPEHVVTDKATFYPSAISYVHAGRQAHGHWLLQPGDLDESLRTKPWLREVAHPSHARSEEFRVRHAGVPGPRRAAVS
jgi:transposase-like protein